MAFPAISLLSSGASFFSKYWKEILIATLISACVWYVKDLNNTIDEKTKEYNTLTADYAASKATYDANIATLNASIEKQNDNITKLNEELKQKEKDIAQYQKDAAERAKKHKQELEDLLNEKSPQTCEASIQYLKDAAGELTWPE